jgi:hypothetical protein
MNGPPATVRITCHWCGVAKDLDLQPGDGDGEEAARSALEREGWEVSDENHLCCPGCSTPVSLDWMALVVVLSGLIGALGIGLLDERPRIVAGLALAWGFAGYCLPFVVWVRFARGNVPGRRIQWLTWVTWLCGLGLGVLAGLHEDRLAPWDWPFICFGGALLASRFLELVRFFVWFGTWLRGKPLEGT